MKRKLIARTLRRIKRYLRLPLDAVEDYRCKKLAKSYYINGGLKRIYLYHIRKCVGTSLHNMFFTLSCEKGSDIYSRIVRFPNLRITINGKVFVGWNKKLIEQGNYFYAFSHIPEHELMLPKDTFTVTCVRNPIDRVLSHYKMLLEFKQNNVPHPCMKIEGKWLGNCFDQFLSNIPKQHLLNQLYMFSKTLDWKEAFNKIVSCSHFLLTEDFSQGVAELSLQLKMGLRPIHNRKSLINYFIKPKELERLRSELEAEYLLYEKLKIINWSKKVKQSSTTNFSAITDLEHRLNRVECLEVPHYVRGRV